MKIGDIELRGPAGTLTSQSDVSWINKEQPETLNRNTSDSFWLPNVTFLFKKRKEFWMILVLVLPD